MSQRQAARPTRDEVYDLLMNARQADWVELALEDGRALSGAIIFNEFKGTGPTDQRGRRVQLRLQRRPNR